MICHVIRYNATDAPFKQAIFSQYTYPHAKQRYAEIADFLHLGGRTDDDKVERLINAIENLKQEVGIPLSIKEVLPDQEREFYEKVEEMAEQAFDDQCTGANPRYPLMRDLKELYVLSYQGWSLGSKFYHQEPATTPPNCPLILMPLPPIANRYRLFLPKPAKQDAICSPSMKPSRCSPPTAFPLCPRKLPPPTKRRC